MNVLVTGSSGTVGSAVVEHLPEFGEYSLTGLDVVEHPDHDTTVADSRDYAAIAPAFEGQDAVVHAAFNTDLNATIKDVRWTGALLDNLWMTCNVFRAAVESGVDRVVYASSNHVVGGYEEEHAPALYDLEHGLTLTADATPRPDSLYAVQKSFDEALCRFCAEEFGVRTYVVRIGNVQPPRTDDPYGPADESEHEPGSEEYERLVARMKAVWFSRVDVANLVDRCLRDDDVSFDVFYGVSGNERSWFDTDHAAEVLGYEPLDAGEEWDESPRVD